MDWLIVEGWQSKTPPKEVFAEEINLKTLEAIQKEPNCYCKIIPLAKNDKYFEIGIGYLEDLKARETFKFLTKQDIFKYKVF